MQEKIKIKKRQKQEKCVVAGGGGGRAGTADVIRV
jgi:hypothetical protein